MDDAEFLTKQADDDKLSVAKTRMDMRQFMGTLGGRRLAWQLLGSFGLFRTSYSPEPGAMAFAEGRRSAGLELLALIDQHCPEQYEQMRRENLAPIEEEGNAP